MKTVLVLIRIMVGVSMSGAGGFFALGAEGPGSYLWFENQVAQYRNANALSPTPLSAARAETAGSLLTPYLRTRSSYQAICLIACGLFVVLSVLVGRRGRVGEDRKSVV